MCKQSADHVQEKGLQAAVGESMLMQVAFSMSVVHMVLVVINYFR
jgi:hypothetical protein